jgi:hypothetical protein
LFFFGGQFGCWAVNEVRAEDGVEGELPAGTGADGVNIAGRLIISNRRKKRAGSSLAGLGYPGFKVFSEPAIVFFYNLVNGQAEKACDFADSLGVERKPYIGAAFAASKAPKILPLGVGIHRLISSLKSYIQIGTDYN